MGANTAAIFFKNLKLDFKTMFRKENVAILTPNFEIMAPKHKELSPDTGTFDMSWTSERVELYLHTVDRTALREFLRK